MSDVIDRAQKAEAQFLHDALNRRHIEHSEVPDEDEHGRYCLGCGDTIPLARLKVVPHAVRCVPCGSVKERP